MYLTLTRVRAESHGTYGTIYGPGYCAMTLELPWNNNRRNISCVPTGQYLLEPFSSDAHPDTYKLWTMSHQEVPGRTDILIHVGNTINDTAGCVLVGYGLGTSGITSSRLAMQGLRDAIVDAEERDVLLRPRTSPVTLLIEEEYT